MHREPGNVREHSSSNTGRKDHAGKGIIGIHGGIKWGWHVQAGQS